MARLRLTAVTSSVCIQCRHNCAAETKAFKAAAKRGKPASYTWHWWHSQTGKPRVIPDGPIQDWRYPPAPHRDTRWNALNKASYERCMQEWASGVHPWQPRSARDAA